jgi:hypothetical protein
MGRPRREAREGGRSLEEWERREGTVRGKGRPSSVGMVWVFVRQRRDEGHLKGSGEFTTSREVGWGVGGGEEGGGARLRVRGGACLGMFAGKSECDEEGAGV